MLFLMFSDWEGNGEIDIGESLFTDKEFSLVGEVIKVAKVWEWVIWSKFQNLTVPSDE